MVQVSEVIVRKVGGRWVVSDNYGNSHRIPKCFTGGARNTMANGVLQGYVAALIDKWGHRYTATDGLPDFFPVWNNDFNEILSWRIVVWTDDDKDTDAVKAARAMRVGVPSLARDGDNVVIPFLAAWAGAGA